MVNKSLCVGLLALCSLSVNAETVAPQDHRQLVEMPPESLVLMRQDMLDHQLALSEIIGLLAENKLEAAAEIAETKMGNSSMGKYRGSAFAPGMHMRPEMRTIGFSMHTAASEFAEVAKTGDTQAALLALQKLTQNCIACHQAYRTR